MSHTVQSWYLVITTQVHYLYNRQGALMIAPPPVSQTILKLIKLKVPANTDIQTCTHKQAPILRKTLLSSHTLPYIRRFESSDWNWVPPGIPQWVHDTPPHPHLHLRAHVLESRQGICAVAPRIIVFSVISYCSRGSIKCSYIKQLILYFTGNSGNLPGTNGAFTVGLSFFNFSYQYYISISFW